MFDDFSGVVLEQSEGERIVVALGPYKAVILRNHGILTVGNTVEAAAAWWYISMDNAAQKQLPAGAAGIAGSSFG